MHRCRETKQSVQPVQRVQSIYIYIFYINWNVRACFLSIYIGFLGKQLVLRLYTLVFQQRYMGFSAQNWQKQLSNFHCLSSVFVVIWRLFWSVWQGLLHLNGLFIILGVGVDDAFVIMDCNLLFSTECCHLRNLRDQQPLL